MNVTVRSRCHRILRYMKNYHSLLPDTNYFDEVYAKKSYPIHLDKDESLIGIYENKVGEDIYNNIVPEIIKDNIIITNKGLHLCSTAGSETLYFKDIIKIEGPKNKINDLIIYIYLKNNVVALPILYTWGGQGKLKDVFEFERFLARVLSDQQKIEEKEPFDVKNSQPKI